MEEASTGGLVYSYTGFAGGIIVACAQFPQVIRVYRRKSAKDISYNYQFTFAVGISMFLVYYGYYSLWSLFIPGTLSLVLILYLIGLKTYLEAFVPRQTSAIDEVEGQSLDSSLIAPEAADNYEENSSGSDEFTSSVTASTVPAASS